MGRDYSPSKPHHDRDGVNGLPSAVAETVLSFFFGLCTERNPNRSGVSPHRGEFANKVSELGFRAKCRNGAHAGGGGVVGRF